MRSTQTRLYFFKAGENVRVSLLLDRGKNQKFLWAQFGLHFNERKSNPEHCILHVSALSFRRLKMKTNLEKSYTTSCLWDNFLLTRPCGCECCQFLLRYAETKTLTWQKKTSSKSFSSSLIFGTSSFCTTTKIISVLCLLWKCRSVWHITCRSF